MQFRSKPISEHPEVPLADDGRLETIVEHWRGHGMPSVAHAEALSYVVSIGAERDAHVRAAQLAEILALVANQGGRVVGSEIYALVRPNPRTLLGKGAAEALAQRARSAGATMLVLDAELSPSQLRDLEDVAGIAVCDREAVILNVFLRHAKTRRARIQVEIAQLQYLRPRIRGVGLDMDQQTGGTARARGPGETASELLARKLDRRLEQLKKALEKLRISERTERRSRSGASRIVLAGYTNAGKTSLMNALSDANLSARDMPFETLDTTSRCLTRHGGDVLISDTVGFIRRLPDRLVASFESTLSEMAEATLLAVVIDASDPERDMHLRTTLHFIDRVGASGVPRFYIWNKIDRLPCATDHADLGRLPEPQPWMAVSSRDPEAMAQLREALVAAARRDEEELSATVPYTDRLAMGLVHGTCRIVTCEAIEDGLRIRVRGARATIQQLRSHLERSSA